MDVFCSVVYSHLKHNSFLNDLLIPTSAFDLFPQLGGEVRIITLQ